MEIETTATPCESSCANETNAKDFGDFISLFALDAKELLSHGNETSALLLVKQALQEIMQDWSILQCVPFIIDNQSVSFDFICLGQTQVKLIQVITTPNKYNEKRYHQTVNLANKIELNSAKEIYNTLASMCQTSKLKQRKALLDSICTQIDNHKVDLRDIFSCEAVFITPNVPAWFEMQNVTTTSFDSLKDACTNKSLQNALEVVFCS